MEKNRTLLQLALVIIILLAFGVAFLRVSNAGKGSGAPQSLVVQNSPQQARSPRLGSNLEWLKGQELLEVPVPQTKADLSNTSAASQVPARQAGAAGAAGAATSQTAGARPPLVRPGSSRAATVYHEAARSFDPAPAPAIPGHTDSAYPAQTAAAPGVYRPSGEEQAEKIFAPYKAGLTREQAAALENQLNGLSSRVERAILQALLPKSKKNANIEKYLQRHGTAQTGSGGAGGPYAQVVAQVAQQKAGIVKSMQNSLGAGAAQEAGKVMDAYQQELASALNTPGLTPEQMAKKARDISRKYNEKLNQVGDKYGLEKFKQEAKTRDDEFLAGVQQAYGGDVAQEMGAIFARARQRELELAQAQLPEKEYYEKMLDSQTQRRKEAEGLLTKNGFSLRALRTLEDQQEQQAVEAQQAQEKAGQRLPLSYRFSEVEKEAVTSSLTQESTEKVQKAQSMYGPQGAALIQKVYDDYAQAMQTILEDTDSSREDKDAQMLQVRQEANKAIEEIQKRPEMRQELEKNQVETTLSQLMQDPGISRATPEQQAAFKQAARPVLQEMFSKINAISESNLPEPEKKRRMEQAQLEAQRQLSGGE